MTDQRPTATGDAPAISGELIALLEEWIEAEAARHRAYLAWCRSGTGEGKGQRYSHELWIAHADAENASRSARETLREKVCAEAARRAREGK